jgi:glycerol kinase
MNNTEPSNALLLIDQGSHSTRAILYSEHGQPLAQHKADVQLFYPAAGQVEMAVDEMLQSIDAVLLASAQSAQLCQKLADCSGLQVMRTQDHEASARGAAFFILQIESTTAQLPLEQFAPKPNSALKKRYQQFQQLMAEIADKS